jgi:hypothetical protein
MSGSGSGGGSGSGTPIYEPEEDDGARYYWIKDRLEELIRDMTDRELEGATIVISELHSYLDRLYFDEGHVLNRRAFVQTMDELYTICTDEIAERNVPEED